ncbi:hypothetical protein [Stenotrophomonas sp. PS02298]|uniref:hypothetical protein n=1 Tax=Stenotrophomonas sp. PS02298 TaxID=2991424 RepID=UPI00249AF053|nr:hypothetical protein [Stenotrophomonas sp. PS02298]
MSENTNSTSEQLEVNGSANSPFFTFNFHGDVNIHLNPEKEKPASIVLVAEGHATAASLQDALKTRMRATPKAEAPSIIVRDPAQPLKVMADGHQVDARETVTDHVALIFPDTGIWVHPATLARDGKSYDSQESVETAAKGLQLLDYDDWHLSPDTVYDRHVIDRRYRKPAADPNLYPHLLLDDWYWTSTIVPGSPASAFSVALDGGDVYSLRRGSSGFGLACRRARQ